MKAYRHTFNTMSGFQNYVKTVKVPPNPPRTIIQPPSKVGKTAKRVVLMVSMLNAANATNWVIIKEPVRMQRLIPILCNQLPIKPEGGKES